MITRMRRLSVILHHSEREPFLAGLQNLGLVHVTLSEAEPSTALEKTLARQRDLGKIITRLKALPADKVVSPAAPPCDAETACTRFGEIDKRLQNIEQGRAQLEKERAWLLPWGEFDPLRIRTLQAAGISVRLFEASVKAFKKLDLSKVAASVISQINGRVYFVLVERGAPIALPLDETLLLPRPLSVVNKLLEEMEVEARALEKEMAGFAACLPLLEQAAASLVETLDYGKVREGLPVRAEGCLLLLSGYCPAVQEGALRAFMAGFVCHAEFADPRLNENVPVQLSNSAFARLFEPITKIFALPSYHEFDPTPLFAPFFALYTGLCLGDVAYGSIILIVGLIASFKAPLSLRPVFQIGRAHV